jgi:uncharacterized SAM-binding protein YcdF (DUF218 family)
MVEADAMADDLVRAGVSQRSIVRERCSLTTPDNARLSGRLLRRLGARRITLVTCEWHMARAAQLFRQEGLEVDALPATTPEVTTLVRWYRAGHEWASARLHAVKGTHA